MDDVKIETEVETVIRLQAKGVRDLYPEVSEHDPHSRICYLCGSSLKDKTDNLTRHFERFHPGALIRILEQKENGNGDRKPRKNLINIEKGTKNKKKQKTIAKIAQSNHQNDSKIKMEGGNNSKANANTDEDTLFRWFHAEHISIDVLQNREFLAFIQNLNRKSVVPSKMKVLRENGEHKKMGDRDLRPTQNNSTNLLIKRSLVFRHMFGKTPRLTFDNLVNQLPSGEQALVKIDRIAIPTYPLKRRLANEHEIESIHFYQSIIGTVISIGSNNLNEASKKLKGKSVFYHYTSSIVQLSTWEIFPEYVLVPMKEILTLSHAVPKDLVLLSPEVKTALEIEKVLINNSARSLVILSNRKESFIRFIRHIITHRTGIDPDDFFSLVLMDKNQQIEETASLEYFEEFPLSRRNTIDVCIICESLEKATALKIASNVVKPCGTILFIREYYLLEHRTSLLTESQMNDFVVNEVLIDHCKSEDLTEAVQLIESGALYNTKAFDQNKLLSDPLSSNELWIDVLKENTKEFEYIQLIS